MIELYGDEHSGKTTTGLHLLAKHNPDSRIVIADIEGTLIDKEWALNVLKSAGFTGTVELVDYTEKKKGEDVARAHEDMLGDALDALLDDDVSGGMLDSIGLFYTRTARAKDLGARDVGQRASTIGDASREISCNLRELEKPKIFIYINHVHPNIGQQGGFYTPGGRTKQQVAGTRMWIRRKESDIPKGSGNFLAEISVQKLKFGGAHTKRKAWLFIIPGLGVSSEMTAVLECDQLKLVSRTPANVILNGEKMGRIGTLAEKAIDPVANADVFQPFHAALEEYYASI